jgi:uncharacterized protein (TIGR03084 family)
MAIGKRGAASSQDEAAYRQLCDDLVAEEDSLDAIVSRLDESSWSSPTPAEGWDVRDQISHLAAAEELAALAVSDPAGFADELTRLMADLKHTAADHLGRGRAMTVGGLLVWWRAARSRTVEGLRSHDPADRVPWAAGEMGAKSFVTARLMETWAHGQDIADALGVERVATARLRHVALLGVKTRGFSYGNRGMPAPLDDVRVELQGPDGQEWAWGADGAVNRITGPALDFCLVVTQRRHVRDTSLGVSGAAAIEWMAIAQAFAGPPTAARSVAVAAPTSAEDAR